MHQNCVCNACTTCPLSITGKNLVIRCEGLSILLYVVQAWPIPRTCAAAVTRAIFHFIWRSRMDRVCRDIMYKDLDKGGKNVPNATLTLMATFVCGCIKLCVDPQYANTKCHYLLRLYLSPVLRRMGLALLPWNTPSSWTVPYHLSFVEKLVKRNIFDHKAIRRWSARSIFGTLRVNERVDPVGWFPTQTAKVIWQNASSPELSNKHQDIAWLVVRRALPVRSFMHARTLRHRTLPSKTHTEANITCSWRTINAVKDTLWSARNLLVFQLKELTPTECCRLAHSKVQDYMLRDALNRGAAAAK
eukprot:g47354.t1